MAGYGSVHVDVGTGDGRAVLRTARRDPDRLVIGLDAAAGPMAEASRRAARTGPHGLPNALFAVAGVETPPGEIVGRADLVSATFPWGSLLAGVLGIEPRAMTGLASLVAPGGSLEALVSVEPRDRLAGLGPDVLAAARLERAWAGRGGGDRRQRVIVGEAARGGLAGWSSGHATPAVTSPVGWPRDRSSAVAR